MVNMCNNVHGRRGQIIRESGSEQDRGLLFSSSGNNKREKVKLVHLVLLNNA